MRDLYPLSSLCPKQITMLHPLSRNSSLYAEPYAMQLQPPPTSDNPDKEPLLTPDEFRALVARIQRNARRATGLGKAAIITNTIAVTIGLLLLWDEEGAIFALFAVCVVFVNALTTRLFAHSVRKDETEVEGMIRFITTTQDVRLLGTILDVYDTFNHPGNIFARVRKVADSAVGRLLPLLQSVEADVLNSQQRAKLRRGLFQRIYYSDTTYYSRVIAYRIAVLYALEKTGDKRDLPDVERLLEDKRLPEDILPAAERCAQVIRKRIVGEEDQDVLLRADRKPEAIETLLRPSTESADTPPQQLLRAATSDDGNTPV